MDIAVNGRACSDAPTPSFRRKMINEYRFGRSERYKSYNAVFNPGGKSEVEWLSQEEDYHTSDWSEEVRRAFKANGAPSGHVVECRYGSRGRGFTESFELVVG